MPEIPVNLCIFGALGRICGCVISLVVPAAQPHFSPGVKAVVRTVLLGKSGICADSSCGILIIVNA